MKPVLYFVLLLLLSSPLLAQQPWALKAYSITLPQVNTTQQNTPATVPQQSGSMVYNADQQQVAVHNGQSWQYLGAATAATSQYKNFKGFNYQSAVYTWTVPAGVTQIMVEARGGGGGGRSYESANYFLSATGGGGGGYTRKVCTVTPGLSVTITVGSGGNGAYGNTSSESGTMSLIQSLSDYFGVNGGTSGHYGGRGGTGLSSNGNNGPVTISGQAGYALTFSYEPRGSTNYVLQLKMGNGGMAYQGQPGGTGSQVALLNGELGGGNSGSIYPLQMAGEWATYAHEAQKGGYPGGGGGGGFFYGGRGADGLVIVYW